MEALPMTGPAYPGLWNFRLGLDPAGSPLVLVSAGQGCALAERQEPGQWTLESVPLNSPPLASYDFTDFLAGPAGGRNVFFYRAYTGANIPFSQELCLVQKTAGVWGAVQVLATDTATGAWPAGPVAMTPDGSRLAYAYRDYQGTSVLLFDHGAWTTLALGPAHGPPFLGFGPDGKFYSLQNVGDPGLGGDTTYVLYTEQ